jgi:methylmalonyl-CoA/ethylmalonyl-CoA epimerase
VTTREGEAVFGLSRIGQIAIGVEDLERATAFYRDILGLRFLFTAPPGMAFFDCGGIRLLLGGPESGAQDPGSGVLYYFVDDIRSAVDTLRSRGVRFEKEATMIARLSDREVWLAEFQDSEGNPAALMSEPPLS